MICSALADVSTLMLQPCSTFSHSSTGLRLNAVNNVVSHSTCSDQQKFKEAAVLLTEALHIRERDHIVYPV